MYAVGRAPQRNNGSKKVPQEEKQDPSTKTLELIQKKFDLLLQSIQNKRTNKVLQKPTDLTTETFELIQDILDVLLHSVQTTSDNIKPNKKDPIQEPINCADENDSIEKIKSHLEGLLHSFYCEFDPDRYDPPIRRCTFIYCKPMKFILHHILYDHYSHFEFCPMQHCHFSYLILSHVRTCGILNCVICKPYPQAITFQNDIIDIKLFWTEPRLRDSVPQYIRDGIVEFLVDNVSSEWNQEYVEIAEELEFENCYSEDVYLRKLAGTVCDPPGAQIKEKCQQKRQSGYKNNIAPIKKKAGLSGKKEINSTKFKFEIPNFPICGYPHGFFNGLSYYYALVACIGKLRKNPSLVKFRSCIFIQNDSPLPHNYI